MAEPSTRAKWRALRSAGSSTLKKGIDSADIVRDAWLQQPYVRFSVEISGLTDLLLLYDLRSGLGDAAFYEISLNFEFLLRAQVHHGIEGQVAG